MIFLFETKKIIKKKITFFSLLFLFIWILGSIFYVVNSTSWSEGSGELVFGIEAVKLAKENKSKWNNTLTEDIITEVIKSNLEIKNNPKYKNDDGTLSNEGYGLIQEFSDIRDIINRSFCDFFTYDYYKCDTLRPEQSALFYENRVNIIKNWLNDSPDTSRLSSREKEYFINSAEELKTPFIYSYMDGWNNGLNYISMIIILSVLIICIIVAATFSGEYESGSDYIVLTSKYGRNKVIYSKILSSFAISTAIYFCSVLLFGGIILILYGFDGYNCPIQSNNYCWKSFYHFTNAEALAVIMSIGYIGCLLMTFITISISSVFKTSFIAIIVPFLLIILPQMIDISNMPIFVQKIFALLPHQTTIGLSQLGYYNVFLIGNYIITPIQLIPIIYLLLICILIPFTIYGFRNHEIT